MGFFFSRGKELAAGRDVSLIRIQIPALNLKNPKKDEQICTNKMVTI